MGCTWGSPDLPSFLWVVPLGPLLEFLSENSCLCASVAQALLPSASCGISDAWEELLPLYFGLPTRYMHYAGTLESETPESDLKSPGILSELSYKLNITLVILNLSQNKKTYM